MISRRLPRWIGPDGLMPDAATLRPWACPRSPRTRSPSSATQSPLWAARSSSSGRVMTPGNLVVGRGTPGRRSAAGELIATAQHGGPGGRHGSVAVLVGLHPEDLVDAGPAGFEVDGRRADVEPPHPGPRRADQLLGVLPVGFQVPQPGPQGQ